MLRLIELSLACWRLSSLIVNEDGPFDLFGKLRYAAGVRYDEHSKAYGTNPLAQAITCTWCASVWVALIVYLLMATRPGAWLMRVLAISAGAILVEEMLSENRKGL